MQIYNKYINKLIKGFFYINKIQTPTLKHLFFIFFKSRSPYNFSGVNCLLIYSILSPGMLIYYTYKYNIVQNINYLN